MLNAISPHHHIYFAAFARTQQLESGSAIGRHFQKTHAAQNSKDFPRSAFSIVCANARSVALGSNRDLKHRRIDAEQLWRILRSDVSDQVAKAIHFQHHSSQRPLIYRLGAWRAKADIVGDLFAKAIRMDPLG